jgi:hypothetical protein
MAGWFLIPGFFVRVPLRFHVMRRVLPSLLQCHPVLIGQNANNAPAPAAPACTVQAIPYHTLE